MFLFWFQRYEQATSHILDALVLQDSDGVKDGTGMNDGRGVTSSTLWDSLKTTCLHLQRADLASMCDRRDLDGVYSSLCVYTCGRAADCLMRRGCMCVQDSEARSTPTHDGPS